MTETAPVDAAAAPAAAPAKPQKKKPAAVKGGLTIKELILSLVATCKDRKGMSYVTLKKLLQENGFDVEHKSSLVKRAIKSLVESGDLVQLKGTGASGSFKVKAAEKPKKAAKKPAAAAVVATKAKKPVTPKKVAKKPVTPKKVAKKPAAAKKAKKATAAKKVAAKKPAKKVATPKKTATPKKAAKKAAKPKAKKPAAKKPAKK